MDGAQLTPQESHNPVEVTTSIWVADPYLRNGDLRHLGALSRVTFIVSEYCSHARPETSLEWNWGYFKYDVLGSFALP